MSDAQLLEYINQQLRNGALKEQVKNSLIAGGWKATDVDEAFKEIAAPDPAVPLPPGATRPLPGVMEIFKQAFDIYKQRFGTFALILVIPALLSAISIVGGPVLKQLLPGSTLAFYGIEFIFYIVFIVGETWGAVALVTAIKDREEKIGVKVAYARAWNKILSYIWISLITTFIVAGGFILLIVPGVIFSIWFSMAVYILVSENIKGMNALLRSKAYAQGRWFDLFIRYLALGLLIVAILIVERIILSFLPTTYALGVQNIVNSIFISPFVIAYLFLVYFHLKASKDEAAVAAVRTKKAGFIVIGIIGLLFIPALLSAVAMVAGLAKKTALNTTPLSNSNASPGLGSSVLEAARQKANDTKRLADIKQIQTAIGMYYADNDKLPATLNDLTLYGQVVDPTTNQPYQYTIDPNGTDYTVCATMESTNKQECIGPNGLTQ